MPKSEEIERTIEHAEEAVAQIRKNRTPAYPKTYEVWYTHLSGNNKDLSLEIEGMLEKYGRISPGQIVHLHETYISYSGLGDKVDQMGTKIDDEAGFLDKIVKRFHTLTHDFDGTLKQTVADLEIDLDQQTLKKLVERISSETEGMTSHTSELLDQLKIAHSGIQLLHKNLEEVREETLLDQLTMIGNRRHFDRSISRVISDFQITGKPVSLILADIDRFKKFNDRWGHQTGDQVLRLVALAIKGNVKMADIACRYGGEEFAILLPNTKLTDATDIANRIRTAVAKRDVVKRSTGENLGKITISAGVSTISTEDTIETLINRADKFLYAAKNAGRNRVLAETDDDIASVA